MRSRLFTACFGARRLGILREMGVRPLRPISNFVQIIKPRILVVLEVGAITCPDLICTNFAEPRNVSGERHKVGRHALCEQHSRAAAVNYWGIRITWPSIGSYDLLGAGAQAYAQRQNQKTGFHDAAFLFVSAFGGWGLALGFALGVNGLGGVFSSRSIVSSSRDNFGVLGMAPRPLSQVAPDRLPTFTPDALFIYPDLGKLVMTVIGYGAASYALWSHILVELLGARSKVALAMYSAIVSAPAQRAAILAHEIVKDLLGLISGTAKPDAMRLVLLGRHSVGLAHKKILEKKRQARLQRQRKTRCTSKS